MAKTKITELTAITAAQLADGDQFTVVDVSDTTMSSTGTNKKLAKSELAEAAGVAAHAAVTSSVHGISTFGATLVDDADAATARSTLGLGTMATQAAGSVAITGGSVTGINDLAVADGGTGASTAPTALLNLGGAPQLAGRYRNRVAFLGDSITGANSTGDNVATNETTIDNYTAYIPVLSFGRIQYGRSFSTSGQTLAGIRSGPLARLLALPAAQLPGTVVILGGTNDVAVANWTSLSAAAATYQAIISDLLAVGIRPVMCTIPPRGDSTTANGNASQLNAWIRWYGQQQGIPVLDFHSALVNPSTGNYTTAYDSGDGIHPSAEGHMAMATLANSTFLAEFAPASSHIARANAYDTSDIALGYGLMLTDTNADGVPDGWTTYTPGNTTGITRSLQNPSASEIVGKWQRISRTTGGLGTYSAQINFESGFTVGHRIALAMRLRATGLSGANSMSIVLSFNNTSDSVTWGSQRDIDGVVYLERAIPAGATSVKVSVNVGLPTTGTTVVDFAQVAIRSLTTLGVA